jgi:hypothetical protein
MASHHAHAAGFTSFPTNRAELARLIDRHQPAVVRFKACLLAGWLRDL